MGKGNRGVDSHLGRKSNVGGEKGICGGRKLLLREREKGAMIFSAKEKKYCCRCFTKNRGLKTDSRH